MLRSCLIALILLLPTHAAWAESESDIVAARMQKFDGKIPQSHPRLLLTKTDITQFRAFVAQFRTTREGEKLWKKIAIDAGLTPPAEPEALPEKKRANNPEIAKLWRIGYDAANDSGNTAWRYALMYQITGEEKYGREAARWLLALADWQSDRKALRNNDEQFIQATRPMIFAYDWAYDALTPAERKTLEKNLLARIELLNEDQQRLFSLTKPTAPSSSLSHPMRFISTVGQGGLALYHEQKDARPLLAWVYEYYNRQFPVWGGEAGGWAEGLDYWATGLTQHLRFLDGMKQLGFDDPLKRGFFRNNAYFALFNLMPYPGSSFGDLTNITKPDPSRALLLEKYALLNGDPYPLAFSRKLADGYPDGFSYYTFNAIDTLLHQFRRGQAKLADIDLTDLPQSRYFADIGWVAMHSKLGSKQDDIMLTLKSSPFGSASHSHNDQNAFVINAFGEPLAIQSGYRDWYDSAHHTGWTRQTQSKNAILIDGQGQPSKDPNAKGSIRHYQSGKHFTFATGDASPAYATLADKALRHVLFVNRRYFVMLDEVRAKQDSRFQWLLHAREEMQLEPQAGAIVSRKGHAALRVSFLAPAAGELQFSQTDQFTVPVDKSFSKGRPNEWHARVETKQAQSVGEFLTVLYPYREAAAASRSLPASKGFAAQVETASGLDVVLLAREAESQVVCDSGLLQGRAGFVTRNKELLASFALVEGRRLQSGDLALAASVPLTLEGQIAADGWTLALNPHPVVELKMALPFAPKSIQGLDVADWHYDGRELTMKLSADIAAIVIRK